MEPPNEFLIWSCVSLLIAMMMLWFYGLSGLVFFICSVLCGSLSFGNRELHRALRTEKKQRENGTFEPPNPSFLELQQFPDQHDSFSFNVIRIIIKKPAGLTNSLGISLMRLNSRQAMPQ